MNVFIGPEKELHQSEAGAVLKFLALETLNFNKESVFLLEDFNNVHNNVMAHGVYNDDNDSLFPWL